MAVQNMPTIFRVRVYSEAQYNLYMKFAEKYNFEIICQKEHLPPYPFSLAFHSDPKMCDTSIFPDVKNPVGLTFLEYVGYYKSKR